MSFPSQGGRSPQSSAKLFHPSISLLKKNREQNGKEEDERKTRNVTRGSKRNRTWDRSHNRYSRFKMICERKIGNWKKRSGPGGRVEADGWLKLALGSISVAWLNESFSFSSKLESETSTTRGADS